MYVNKLVPLLAIVLLISSGCESTYYSAMEKVGIHKRDILADRIKETQSAQEESKEQFASALDEQKSLTQFDGGELEARYGKLTDEYEDSLEIATEITARINKVEDVAEDLFAEWQTELEQYSNRKLRTSSERKLRETKQRYSSLVSAMRKAEKKMDPVLSVLKDNVLFLKHNLNAKAVASIKDELQGVQQDVDQLISAMEKSINESKAFIASLESS